MAQRPANRAMQRSFPVYANAEMMKFCLSRKHRSGAAQPVVRSARDRGGCRAHAGRVRPAVCSFCIGLHSAWSLHHSNTPELSPGCRRIYSCQVDGMCELLHTPRRFRSSSGDPSPRGTDGSNPSSSSAESAANFVSGREAWKGIPGDQQRALGVVCRGAPTDGISDFRDDSLPVAAPKSVRRYAGPHVYNGRRYIVVVFPPTLRLPGRRLVVGWRITVIGWVIARGRVGRGRRGTGRSTNRDPGCRTGRDPVADARSIHRTASVDGATHRGSAIRTPSGSAAPPMGPR